MLFALSGNAKALNAMNLLIVQTFESIVEWIGGGCAGQAGLHWRGRVGRPAQNPFAGVRPQQADTGANWCGQTERVGKEPGIKPNNSFCFVYRLLEGAMPQLKADTLPNSFQLPMLDSPLRHLASVFVPDYGPLNAPFRLTSAEIVGKWEGMNFCFCRLCWQSALCWCFAFVPCCSCCSVAANGHPIHPHYSIK